MVWVVAHAAGVRLYNPVALALALALLGCVEMAVRFTNAERYWTEPLDGNGAGSRRTMLTTFEGLSGASTADYPTSGFPPRAPPRSAPVRIVCLGSSSTGGAFQNDDLAEFYPARLAQRLGPAVEVVNQGVGGWASFHVEKFAATYLPGMEPDVVTVYLGMNEATPATTTYADLYAQWASGNGAATPNPLYGLRLFNGLRFVVQAARGPFGDAAVPPAAFEANLEELTASAAAVGARLLLLSEAIQPSPDARAAYWERMRAVDARHDDVVFLDTAQTLADAGAGLFLDANHLSSEGHRLLAGLLADELQRLDWLQPKAAAPR
jgi:lysophospholipase L1-like esterase